jgi:hypothetical protein
MSYDVFCGWSGWAQYAWAVGISLVLSGLGFWIGWTARMRAEGRKR